jgi:hypothetical protein
MSARAVLSSRKSGEESALSALGRLRVMRDTPGVGRETIMLLKRDPDPEAEAEAAAVAAVVSALENVLEILSASVMVER